MTEGDQSPDSSLYHVSGNRCFAAVALGSGVWSGKPLLSGPAGEYVYLFCKDGPGLFAAKRIYAKSELPGKLVLKSHADDPRSVTLVDLSPLGNRILETRPWKHEAQGIGIDIPPTLQAYWVLPEW